MQSAYIYIYNLIDVYTPSLIVFSLHVITQMNLLHFITCFLV